MKKSLITILIAGVMFSMSGCISDLKSVELPPIPSHTPEIAPAPVSTPEPTPEAVEDLNKIFIRMQEIELTENDPEEGYNQILRFSCQIPSVEIENNETASQMINAVLSDDSLKYFSQNGEVGTAMDEFNYLHSLAIDNYTPENNPNFAFTRVAEVLRADNAVIALKFTSSRTLFDKEHPEISEEIFWFDTKTGMLIDEYAASNLEYAEPERSSEPGSIHIADEGTGLSTDYDIIDLITVDEDGEDYYIYCDGPVYDLRIGDQWFCSRLEGEAVQVRLILPEGMHSLLVSFNSEGNLYNWLISRNAQNGQPEFLDYSELTAVG